MKWLLPAWLHKSEFLRIDSSSQQLPSGTFSFLSIKLSLVVEITITIKLSNHQNTYVCLSTSGLPPTLLAIKPTKRKWELFGYSYSDKLNTGHSNQLSTSTVNKLLLVTIIRLNFGWCGVLLAQANYHVSLKFKACIEKTWWRWWCMRCVFNR